jgi:hypothetical protein
MSMEMAMKRKRAAKAWVAVEFMPRRGCQASSIAGASEVAGMKKLVWPAVARYWVYRKGTKK